ncbi:hypothetical protein DFQ30_008656 [Apophysomyces sp. BC1015]|nr:hypothetical protein DFQ30_008656 [Apophysomyces sp. BC1015]
MNFQGSIIDESGCEAVDIVIDEKQYALEIVTCSTQCLDNKPEERVESPASMETYIRASRRRKSSKAPKECQRATYTNQDKANFLGLKQNSVISARAAVKKLGINVHVEYKWA